MLSAAYAANEILVQFAANATAAQFANARGAVSGWVIEAIQTASMRAGGSGRLERIMVPQGSALSGQSRRSLAAPGWSSRNRTGRSQPPRRAKIHSKHPDLQANIWSNPFDIPGDGINNDGNGYADDVNGWDFYSRDNTVYDGGTGEEHGTHLAGTIGGVGGNGIGVAGVSWNVTLIPLEFLGADGGYTSDAVKPLDFLTDLKVRHGLNVVASNNFWGGGGYSTALHSAINRSADASILFVAAAGNSALNTDVSANYPSNYSSLQATSTARAAAAGQSSRWPP